ncbi:MAG: hypothetical protein P1P71_02035 [Anaerosomatales bacterium]|nr:hypothetical protein [Anaerosomatales bacterium]
MRPTLRMIAVCLVAALAGGVVAGCSQDVAEPPPPVTEPTETGQPEQPAEEPAEPVEPSAIAWLDTELVDVETGETFRISDFAGTPVLVKSFAVW